MIIEKQRRPISKSFARKAGSTLTLSSAPLAPEDRSAERPGHFRERGVHIREADNRIIDCPRIGPTIAHAASRPRRNERHPMPALIAAAFVTAKRPGGDIAVAPLSLVKMTSVFR